jgi:hypothetical protein
MRISKEEHVEMHYNWYKEFRNTNDLRASNMLKNYNNLSMKGENHPFYGNHRSIETRKKISKTLKEIYKNNPLAFKNKKKCTSETKKKISESKKGRKLSEEHKKKISLSQLGEKHHRYNKKLNQEHKKRISKALRGRKLSEETKRKMKDFRKNGNVFNSKKVKSINIISKEEKIFNSLSICGKYYNICYKTVSNRIKKNMIKNNLRFEFL